VRFFNRDPAQSPPLARETGSTDLVASLFVRMLGLVFASAFLSLSTQVVGLVGARGIAPATELLALASERLGPAAWIRLPGWLWLCGSSDSALRALCAVGVACAVLLVAGRTPRTAILVAWSCYLSLCAVGDVFLSYQWDALLLETALVALFVATPGSRIGIWLARALLFKLMFLSGVVKLASGDPTWRDLSALSYHWWTQPLPTFTSALANALPARAQSAQTFAALVTETLVPFSIFAPRRVRLAGAAALSLLQLLIAATGNYGFFNLLTLALCATLLDDAALAAICPRWLLDWLGRSVAEPPSEPVEARRAMLAGARHAAHLTLAFALLAASAIVALEGLLPLPSAVRALVAPIAPLRSVNSYGLFAVMTTERREIAIEGSADGVTWRRYTFRWKPDALTRRPRFTTPHMPRLDWQMWFAALGSCEHEPWLLAFLTRLLEGPSPEVSDLLETNPFPDTPPRYLRTPVALYRFAPLDRALHGTWWTKREIGSFCPAVTLQNGRLSAAENLRPD
jgi:hypothetical protein